MAALFIQHWVNQIRIFKFIQDLVYFTSLTSIFFNYTIENCNFVK